ncbi:hypothetical protein [Priestia megaterium]|uniref:hypothetical protein n=1 Tax=Priestia megaterium TaxID=1404 RepID=UPI003A89B1BF
MFLMSVNQTLNNDELIKEMQDKVVALQDHEISFLNDTIANIWATVGIGAGIIVGIAGFVGWLINRSNQKAQQKMQLAEQILGDAQVAKEELLQYKADLEVYREETRKEFSELISLVNSERIANLKNDIVILSITSQIRGNLEECQRMIDNGWQDYKYLLDQTVKYNVVKEYRDCQISIRTIRDKVKEPLLELTRGKELLDDSMILKEEVLNIVTELQLQVEALFFEECIKDQMAT